MSLNSSVQFYGGSLASPRPMIRHLGVINLAQPIVKTEEAIGLAAGAGLLGGGLIMKGKGGMVMAILGGLTALVTGGLTLMRHMSPAPTAVVQLPAAPAAPKPSSTQQLLTTFAPVAQQLAPLVQNLFAKPTPPPAPTGAIVTSL